MDSNSREHEREAIDAEIKSLEESILALKHHRNALAPISSLPSEVFAAIFSSLRVTTSAFTPGQNTDPLAWIRVAHVCHQWRDMVLNQPLFWNHVNFTTLSAAGAAEILARSKTAPLYLEARVLGSHWDNTRYSAFQEELQACVPRTCHLHISASFWNLRNTFDRLIVSPAPTLESLSLSSERQLLQPDIPDTLFGGSTPRLSCLELRNCNISWNSPLLKGLRYLQIRWPSMKMMPSLSVWLDALDEMPQLKTLILHAASPVAGSFPFDVKRTAKLPSLTHMDITDSPRDCAFALAHLDLPALTCLCIQTLSCPSDGEDVQEVLPYVTRDAHTQPLQSMLIRGKKARMAILAWPVPDIDVEPEVNEPPTLVAAPPAYVALSITSKDWNRFENHLEFLDMVMAALPMDNLVTLIVQDFRPPPFEKFWYRNSLRWPLLRRVRLTPVVATIFAGWLVEDKGDSLLPSLKEIVLVDTYLDEHRTRGLCDALMKLVEQGVPLEMLDLRTCFLDSAYLGAVQLLREIVVDVPGPEEALDARARIRSMWDRLDEGPFVKDDDNKEANRLEADEDDSDTGSDDEEEDDEE